MSIYNSIQEMSTGVVSVSLQKYEEGIRAAERNEIIKRMLNHGCISVQNINDILDIKDSKCDCKCGECNGDNANMEQP